MIGVVAAMGGEIEGYGKALLPRRQIAPVEGVGILRRGEPGILADGPRLGDIHGGIGAAQERRDAWIGVETVEVHEVVRPVRRFHRDAFRGQPWGAHGARCRRRVGKVDFGKVRDTAHQFMPSSAAPVPATRQGDHSILRYHVSCHLSQNHAPFTLVGRRVRFTSLIEAVSIDLKAEPQDQRL